MPNLIQPELKITLERLVVDIIAPQLGGDGYLVDADLDPFHATAQQIAERVLRVVRVGEGDVDDLLELFTQPGERQ